MDIKLKKFSFRTMLPNARDFYNRLEVNRDRLAPWFWWTRKEVTPNFQKMLWFMCMLVLDTKRKKLAHNLTNRGFYNEQFLIYTDGKVAGMVGLDDIDDTMRQAELWYFATIENESRGVIRASVKILEDYAFGAKKLNSIYAKVVENNLESSNFLHSAGYKITKTEYNVPTSKKNPDITNLTTWTKGR